MCELGNTVINQIYEGSCEELGAKKPGPSSSRSVSIQQSNFSKTLKIPFTFFLMIIYLQTGERDLDQI